MSQIIPDLSIPYFLSPSVTYKQTDSIPFQDYLYCIAISSKRDFIKIFWVDKCKVYITEIMKVNKINKKFNCRASAIGAVSVQSCHDS